jgi:hypothetical protein
LKLEVPSLPYHLTTVINRREREPIALKQLMSIAFEHLESLLVVARGSYYIVVVLALRVADNVDCQGVTIVEGPWEELV